MSKFRKRYPRTKDLLRDKADGTHRPGQGYIPTDQDDIMTRRQRNWKKFRKTKYRLKDDPLAL